MTAYSEQVWTGSLPALPYGGEVLFEIQLTRNGSTLYHPVRFAPPPAPDDLLFRIVGRAVGFPPPPPPETDQQRRERLVRSALGRSGLTWGVSEAVGLVLEALEGEFSEDEED